MTNKFDRFIVWIGFSFPDIIDLIDFDFMFRINESFNKNLEKERDNESGNSLFIQNYNGYSILCIHIAISLILLKLNELTHLMLDVSI